jgi:hypothetical protein
VIPPVCGPAASPAPLPLYLGLALFVAGSVLLLASASQTGRDGQGRSYRLSTILAGMSCLLVCLALETGVLGS